MRKILPLLAFGLLAFGLLGVVSGASAQSPFGVQGLGLPLEPMNARARALGGMGVGLMGSSLMPTDPAAAAYILAPTLHLSAQPFWGDADLGGDSFTGQGTRFPLMGIAFPVMSLGGTATLTLGGFMDQRWEVEREGTEELGGVEIPVLEEFASDGGVSTVRFGWAQRIGDRLAVAADLGGRVGSVTRTFTRTLDTSDLQTVVDPYVESVQWQYSGFSTSLGVLFAPLEILRVSGTLTLSGDLEAKPASSSEKEGATYKIPTEYRVGVAARMTPRLAMNVGLSHANWEASSDGLEPETVAGAVWGFGAGAEWLGPQVASRFFPIRLGFRRNDLPFQFDGQTPTETAFSGGIGLNLTPSNAVVLGAVDLALERGSREAGTLSETFWRGTVTFRVSTW